MRTGSTTYCCPLVGYESFPLFPLEAMACGLAVITTAPGTEDYAVNQENCLVVEPKIFLLWQML